MFTYLYVILAFTLNATANILVKQANIYAELGLLQNWFPTAYGRTIIYAVVCLSLSFVCFNLASRFLPISVLYSIHVGMSLLFITTSAWFLLGEKLATTQYIGIIVLIVGMILITMPYNPAITKNNIEKMN